MTEYRTKLFSNSKQGLCNTFDLNGSLILQENYIDGNLEGELKEYYNNGKIKIIVSYKNDRPWNIIDYKDNNGNKLDFGTFKNGNGIIKLYSDDGLLRRSGELKSGLKEGFWLLYSNRGLYDSILYKHGIKEGESFVDNVF